MVGPLPHSNKIQELTEQFLGEVATHISKAHATLKKSAEFNKIYRVSLATDAVLSELLQSDKRPPRYAALSIVKGIPLLVSARQIGSARIELRRFIELILWGVYFSEHPIEWDRFSADPTNGFTRDDKDPIAYCAHRELEYYLNYAKSRISGEPSTLLENAVGELRSLKGELNKAVHPGACTAKKVPAVPLDPIDNVALKEFNDLQHSVFKNICLLVAALRKNRFDALPAMHRAHFDWLVGTQLSKQIRSSAFGL